MTITTDLEKKVHEKTQLLEHDSFVLISNHFELDITLAREELLTFGFVKPYLPGVVRGRTKGNNYVDHPSLPFIVVKSRIPLHELPVNEQMLENYDDEKPTLVGRVYVQGFPQLETLVLMVPKCKPPGNFRFHDLYFLDIETSKNNDPRVMFNKGKGQFILKSATETFRITPAELNVNEKCVSNIPVSNAQKPEGYVPGSPFPHIEINTAEAHVSPAHRRVMNEQIYSEALSYFASQLTPKEENR